jgi:MFS family permease
VSAPLAGRVVTRIGRRLVVAGAVTFGVGAIAMAVIATHIPDGHATLALAPPLFVMGCGQGMLITPNQTLALMDVDPLMGSAAGGVLQTGQRIGLAIGQALIGAVFFTSLTGDSTASYSRALGHAVIAAICFVSIAVAIGVHDLVRTRRREQVSDAARPKTGAP